MTVPKLPFGRMFSTGTGQQHRRTWSGAAAERSPHQGQAIEVGGCPMRRGLRATAARPLRPTTATAAMQGGSETQPVRSLSSPHLREETCSNPCPALCCPEASLPSTCFKQERARDSRARGLRPQLPVGSKDMTASARTAAVKTHTTWPKDWAGLPPEKALASRALLGPSAPGVH